MSADPDGPAQTPYERLAVLAGLAGPPCEACGRRDMPSVRVLAGKVGLSHATVQRMKNAQTSPTMDSVQRVAGALHAAPARVVAALWPGEPH